ncbi:hypothetical protein BDL97_01G073400 [Sphagnum fallax]|nr:hypothetical protein BDL97_01G073400 [Sphagnum fallax]
MYSEMELEFSRAYVASLLHLLLLSDNSEEDMSRVVSTVFMPILHYKDPKLLCLQTEVIQGLAMAMVEQQAWNFIRLFLVCYCLTAIEPRVPLLPLADLDIKDLRQLTVAVACQIVAAVLTAVLDLVPRKSLLVGDGSEKGFECTAATFCKEMVSLFMAPAISMLSQPLDVGLRHHAMLTLLPPLIRARCRLNWDDPKPGENNKCTDARILIAQEIWQCCKALFMHGALQRRDAYMILSVFAELFFPCVQFTLENSSSPATDQTPWKFSAENFDIRDDPLFWDELKAGLVDQDPLTRKRTLYLLKQALPKLALQLNTAAEQVRRHPSGRQKKGMLGFQAHTTKKDVTCSQQNRSNGEEEELSNSSRDQEPPHAWKAFILLYETLEEYGSHLVEAVWAHEMVLLSPLSQNSKEFQTEENNTRDRRRNIIIQGIDVDFTWVLILFDRGFNHKNLHVRRLVLHSFLELDWANAFEIHACVSEEFMLGSLLTALDDPTHHRDFGVRGSYTSETAKAAANFFSSYAASLSGRDHANFIQRLAKAISARSPCRAGLMTIAICLEAAAAVATAAAQFSENKSLETMPDATTQQHPVGHSTSDARDGNTHWVSSSMDSAGHQQNAEVLLEDLKVVIDKSKRHFNPKYRAKVCAHVLAATRALVWLPQATTKLTHFLSAFPKDLLMQGGVLHRCLLQWLHPGQALEGLHASLDTDKSLSEGLRAMLHDYLMPQSVVSSEITDGELEAWRVEVKKWARLFALKVVSFESQLQLIQIVEQHAACINELNDNNRLLFMAEKVLLLLHSLMEEFSVSPVLVPNTTEPSSASDACVWMLPTESSNQVESRQIEMVADVLRATLDELVKYAKDASRTFWEYDAGSGLVELPGSVTGQLGGPSQRRLPPALASAILQGVLAVRTLAESCIWLCMVRGGSSQIPKEATYFLWMFALKVVSTPASENETGAEVQVGCYEALIVVCAALAITLSPSVAVSVFATTWVVKETPLLDYLNVSSMVDGLVDGLVSGLLANVESILQKGALVRSRHAVLARLKWGCLENLLSIAKSSLLKPTDGDDSQQPFDSSGSAIKDCTLEAVAQDAINSLESAGEEYILPILCCIRLLMRWGVFCSLEWRYGGLQETKSQVMWELVSSAWAAMANSNKRKVAPIAAFLSSILHPSIFLDVEMHEVNGNDGPLKWLLCKFIEQGARSPRTMRLTALHITGLWLQYPTIAIFYVKQLKLLSLHGGEAVDEELDGELVESQVAAREYSMLIQSSDIELTEAFTNSEMYVRVTVAVMLHQFVLLIQRAQVSQDSEVLAIAKSAATCGQMLLLELLNAAVEDPNLSKELYKKKSLIHRRKVRVWQMLCILSPFITDDMVSKVTVMLDICLYRNNMPSVRQYIEAFAVHIYLRFPSLVEKNLIPLLQDHNMKMQALSSYVLIATNVLLCTSPSSQQNLLELVLPAILPYMTTHHHNLRSFAQVLIYRILKQFSNLDVLDALDPGPHNNIEHKSGGKEGFMLDQKCLRSIAAYLEGNTDCKRMRLSVERYLDKFDPLSMVTPRGVFCVNEGETDPNRTVDDLPFECAPVAIVDQIALFLNEAREGLREAMAKDVVTLNAELSASHDEKGSEKHGHIAAIPDLDHHLLLSTPSLSAEMPMLLTMTSQGGTWDFQKKITSLRYHEYNVSRPVLEDEDGDTLQNDTTTFGTLSSAIDAEEELLLASKESRLKELGHMQGGRQELIVVASLIDRIPNLAGLARTCEVFKTASLVVADARIVEDRQFQLISVTAERWVPIVEVSEAGLPNFLEHKKKDGFFLIGLEQTANSFSIDEFTFPKKVVLVLGREKEGIPVNLIQVLDACMEIPQLGVIRSLNVHVSGAIAVWEYTRQQRARIAATSK